MAKDFKIARKPGQGTNPQNKTDSMEVKRNTQNHKGTAAFIPSSLSDTTRKTIEVPADYFTAVKIRAAQRKMLEKELWAEILTEYFSNHTS